MKWEEASSSGLRKWAPFGVLALVLHLAVFWLVQEQGFLSPPERSDVRPVKRVKLRTFKKPKPPENQRALAEKKEDKAKLDEELQVVNLPPDHRSERPDDAKFSATTDHSVEKETISRYQTPGYQNAGHELTKSKQSAPVTPQDGDETATDEKVDESGAEPSLAENSTAKANDEPEKAVTARDVPINLGPPLRAPGKFALDTPRPRASSELSRQESAVGQRRKAAEKLIPDFRVLADLDSSPANDVFDEDIELGDGTYLNTRSFKYASFFNRFHRSVSQHWNPITEYRRRDPTGHVYGPRSRYTVLEVELDAEGALISSKVLRSSGLDFLDREAVASLKRAQPFPNPPAGLLDDDRIFFSFGFQVKYGRR